ncbi:MAG: hypothetical protein HY901_03035 [Deltaproteobacteria bacterium]|nr:hypothetical protein [Deltaproteobacteria bacterium]
MAKRSFEVPDDFRDFLREVVKILEGARERSLLDAEDALQSGCGYGGRVDGCDGYQFVYFSETSRERWTVRLGERQIREIAGGRLREVPAEVVSTARQRCSGAGEGDTLLLWGQQAHDALVAEDAQGLAEGLDALHRLAQRRPCGFQVWSRFDDLLHGVLFEDECALQVVWSNGARVSTRREGGAEPRLQIRWADSLSWKVVRPAVLEFARTCQIGELPTDPSADPGLVLVALQGRRAALSRLGEVSRSLAQTSLRDALQGGKESGSALREGDEDLGWARRVLKALVEEGLLEIEDEGVAARGLARLLRDVGDEAVASHEEAEELAEALADLAGVGELYASVDELRRALRDTFEVPVEGAWKQVLERGAR